ncbi:MAG: ATP-binding protein [Hyphomicrobium sp.]
MFFRRAKKDQAENPEVAAALPAEVAPDIIPDIIDVPDETQGTSGEASRDCSTSVSLDFSTTSDLDAYDGWFGQEHVIAAIQSVLESDAPGLHACVVSPPGFGARAAILKMLHAHAQSRSAADDWVYVHNFEDARRPLALQLPAGQGRHLADGMLEALSELSATVPAAFATGEFNARCRQVADEHRAGSEAALADLQHKAAEQNIALLRTPNGYGLAPMHDGKVVKPGVFAQLPHAMRSDIEARIAALQPQLADVLIQPAQSIREQHAALLALRSATAQRVVDAAFEWLEQDLAGVPRAAAFLGRAKASLVRNCDIFHSGGAVSPGAGPGPVHIAGDPKFRRYLVNVIANNGAPQSGAPVHELKGCQLCMSAPATNASGVIDGAHMDLVPGALQIANGGYLFADVRGLQPAGDGWLAMTDALTAGAEIARHPALQPSPVPLNIKTVVLADDVTYRRMCDADPELSSLFRVTVRCAGRMDRSADNEMEFARWIAGLVAQNSQLPLTAAAVAALIGDSALRAEKSGGLSLAQEPLIQVLDEAHRGAMLAEDKVIDAGHVQHVFAQRQARLTPRVPAVTLI